jgi:hypothetical protein
MRHGCLVATILFVFSVLPLAGCAAPGTHFGPEGEGPQTIAPERSIVQLPDELVPARLAVRREVERGVMRERVVLDNDTASPGENAIVVQTRWRGDPRYLFKTGSFTTPHTETSIQGRIAQEFADWRQIAPPVERVNRHGRYRYIAASDDGARCVLAWQMIDAEASLTGALETYALDFRFCDSKRDVDALLALFDQLELQPFL